MSLFGISPPHPAGGRRGARVAALPVALLAVVLAAILAGCGSSGSSTAATGGSTGTTDSPRPDLVVSAASSLKTAFTNYGASFKPAKVRLSFAGSDELAAQIRQGAPVDVYAAANTKLPDDLHRDGLVDKPVVFASNRLVIAVPADSSKVSSVADLAKPGTTIAIGDETVPIGSYTREVLGRLPHSLSSAIEANVRTNEPDVSSIVGKVMQGAVDAGLVYITDVTATGGKLEAVALPSRLQPSVAYGIAVVKSTKHPAQARAFVAGVRGPAGRRALRAAGFEPPAAPGSG